MKRYIVASSISRTLNQLKDICDNAIDKAKLHDGLRSDFYTVISTPKHTHGTGNPEDHRCITIYEGMRKQAQVYPKLNDPKVRLRDRVKYVKATPQQISSGEYELFIAIHEDRESVEQDYSATPADIKLLHNYNKEIDDVIKYIP